MADGLARLVLAMGWMLPKREKEDRAGYVLRIYLILEWCCAAPLAVMPGRAAPSEPQGRGGRRRYCRC